VANALGNLLSLVDLGYLLFKKLVAALTELDNVGALGTPSYAGSVRVGGDHGAWRQQMRTHHIPDTS
jgi:hypothetical protein